MSQPFHSKKCLSLCYRHEDRSKRVKIEYVLNKLFSWSSFTFQSFLRSLKIRLRMNILPYKFTKKLPALCNIEPGVIHLNISSVFNFYFEVIHCWHLLRMMFYFKPWNSCHNIVSVISYLFYYSFPFAMVAKVN